MERLKKHVGDSEAVQKLARAGSCFLPPGGGTEEEKTVLLKLTGWCSMAEIGSRGKMHRATAQRGKETPWFLPSFHLPIDQI